jgi:hypothetical protein
MELRDINSRLNELVSTNDKRFAEVSEALAALVKSVTPKSERRGGR